MPGYCMSLEHSIASECHHIAQCSSPQPLPIYTRHLRARAAAAPHARRPAPTKQTRQLTTVAHKRVECKSITINSGQDAARSTCSPHAPNHPSQPLPPLISPTSPSPSGPSRSRPKIRSLSVSKATIRLPTTDERTRSVMCGQGQERSSREQMGIKALHMSTEQG